MLVAILGWVISLALLGIIVVSSTDRHGISPPFQKWWRVQSTVEWVIAGGKTIGALSIALLFPPILMATAAMVGLGAVLGAPGFMLGWGWGWFPAPVLVMMLWFEANERYGWTGRSPRSVDNY